MANVQPLVAPEPSEADKAKARKWFDRAKTVADSRNYDYAIECYVGGLKVWPEAIEEGHKPLRAVGVARKMAGGKPLGFMQARKFGTGGKDIKENMLNAEVLWANDPNNLSHMEAMLVNAAKGGFLNVGTWIGSIAADALGQEKKPNAKSCAAMVLALDTIGDAAKNANIYKLALDAFQAMAKVTQVWYQANQGSQEALKAYHDAQGKLTIVKGRFDSADGFQDSIKDRDAQKDLQDEQRLVQGDERLEQLAAKAKAEYEADRASNVKLSALVDLLTRREHEPSENQAIEILTQAYADTSNYSLKVRADDIRMRLLTRKARALVAELKANPNDEPLRARAKQHRREQLEFEIQIYRERARNYPTDLRVRYALAERLYKSRAYDEAIPLFQQAQADGKHREQCKLYIGRCFFDKTLYGEAIATLKAAIDAHEMGGRDDVGKEMHYWLGRALEAKGQLKEACDVYGQLIQFDYNYADARQRLEQLRSQVG